MSQESLANGLALNVYSTRMSLRQADEKKVHGWGAIGHGFQSHLNFYNSGNSNGAMTMVEYLRLLKLKVAGWPLDAVLEEDGAKSHGRGKNSIVTKWKKENNIYCYFNCPHSPDLAPIENAWAAPKAWLRKFAHYTEEMVKEVALEGWYKLTLNKINYWCDSLPQRLRDVIGLKGQMTTWYIARNE